MIVQGLGLRACELGLSASGLHQEFVIKGLGIRA